MRNKFSELIDAGVAEFKYINTVTDTSDPICREYNNIYSIYTDTHMNPYKRGYIITGNIKSQEQDKTWYLRAFDKVLCTCSVGMSMGYSSIYQFFSMHNLIGHYEKVNGDDAYVLTLNEPCKVGDCHVWSREEIERMAQDEPDETTCPDCYYECGSNIPRNILELTDNRVEFNKCFENENLTDVVNQLNESSHIRGEYYLYNNRIYGVLNNKNIKL